MNDNDEKIDFAAEDGFVPPADPAFDTWVAGIAPSLNMPTSVPTHEMWEEILSAQRTHRTAQAGQIPGVTPLRRGHWGLAVVIAAALLLGVAIDRVYLRTDGPTADTLADRPATPPEGDAAHLYRMAAAQTLTQAEALLTSYRADPAPAGDPAAAPQLSKWGRDILGSTRLLIDSPAGSDPQLRALLDDLELVLVQIIRLAGDPLDATERALIDRAVNERDLLPRIRTAVPAGVPAVAEALAGD